MQRANVSIYTDGSCEGNPGPGGWAAVLVCGSLRKEISGGCGETTNNRMELTAAVEALRALKKPCAVTLRSDSQYLVKTMTDGWKRKTNNDLWDELDRLCGKHDVGFVWVRGHAGDSDNELCDKLARNAARQAAGK